jgi:Protein of unknown function (DUF3106)
MNRFLKFAAASVLGLVPAWCGQTKEPAAVKAPARPPGKASAVRTPAPKAPAARGAAGGSGRSSMKAMPVFRQVPGAQVQRFLRLTPREREIAIDKMPVAAQDSIRRRLAAFDSLPAEERDRQLKLYAAISTLPKDKQDLVNQRIGEFQQLGPERKLGIRRAYQLLSGKTEPVRQAIIDSPQFKERFTPMEQRIVIDLVRYYPNPEM